MRGFWTYASSQLVAKSIRELLDHVDNQILLGIQDRKDFLRPLVEKAWSIADKLDGKRPGPGKKAPSEGGFIKREFDHSEIDKLTLDGAIQSVIIERIVEI